MPCSVSTCRPRRAPATCCLSRGRPLFGASCRPPTRLARASGSTSGSCGACAWGPGGELGGAHVDCWVACGAAQLVGPCRGKRRRLTALPPAHQWTPLRLPPPLPSPAARRYFGCWFTVATCVAIPVFIAAFWGERLSTEEMDPVSGGHQALAIQVAILSGGHATVSAASAVGGSITPSIEP